MIENSTTPANDIAAFVRSSLSRRRILQAAGIGGVALAAAACGTGGDDAASATSAPSAATAADLSDTDKVANWSNWPLYIDIDEESGQRPSLEAFQAATGVAVTYTEDVNDNNEFFAKVRTQLEQGQDIGRDIVVLGIDHDGALAGRPFDEAVDIVNVDLGLKQRGEYPF